MLTMTTIVVVACVVVVVVVVVAVVVVAKLLLSLAPSSAAELHTPLTHQLIHSYYYSNNTCAYISPICQKAPSGSTCMKFSTRVILRTQSTGPNFISITLGVSILCGVNFFGPFHRNEVSP